MLVSPKPWIFHIYATFTQVLLESIIFYGFINLLMTRIYISKALKYIIHRLKMELNELFGNEGNLSWHYMHFMQNSNIHNTIIVKVITNVSGGATWFAVVRLTLTNLIMLSVFLEILHKRSKFRCSG